MEKDLSISRYVDDWKVSLSISRYVDGRKEDLSQNWTEPLFSKALRSR